MMCAHFYLKVPQEHTLTKLNTTPQAKRLDELDRLYRDEALARKKTHNAMEDLKVGWQLMLAACKRFVSHDSVAGAA